MGLAARRRSAAARQVSSRAASICVAISAILNWMAWKSAIGVAELLALAGVADRGLEGGLGDPDREGGDADPPLVEDPQRVDEAHALAPEQVLGGDPAVLEDELGGVRRAHPELVLLLAGAEAGRPALDDEGRDALLALRRGRSPP